MSGYNAYTGLPGSGKSYNVVKHVIKPAIEQGREVWTNIPLNIPALDALYGHEEWYIQPKIFNITELIDNPNWFDQVLPKGVVFVLDEVQRAYPSGKTAKAFSASETQFFTEFRHRVNDQGKSTQVVLVTQDLDNISSFLRRLVGVTYRHSKLSVIGLNKYKVTICNGPVGGPRTPPNSVLSTSGPHSYEPQVYNLYTSATQSDSGNVGAEAAIDTRNNLLKKPKFLIGAIALPVLLFIGIKFSASALQGGGQKVEPEPAPTGQQQKVTSNVAAYSPKVAVPLDLDRMYISLNIGTGFKRMYRFTLLDGNSRSTFETFELSKLGFEVKSIAACAVVISYNDVQKLVTCQTPDNEKSTGFDMPFIKS